MDFPDFYTFISRDSRGGSSGLVIIAAERWPQFTAMVGLVGLSGLPTLAHGESGQVAPKDVESLANAIECVIALASDERLAGFAGPDGPARARDLIDAVGGIGSMEALSRGLRDRSPIVLARSHSREQVEEILPGALDKSIMVMDRGGESGTIFLPGSSAEEN